MQRFLSCAAVLVVGAGLGFAQAGRSEDQAKSGQDSEKFSDQHFVHKASAAGLAEVNLGRMAVERAMNPSVKQFGQKMVQDHTKANAELMQIADTQKLRPAQQMDQKHQQLTQKLAQLTGTEFDRAFVQHMVADHDEAVHLFKTAAKDCRDPALKAFAAKTLPTLEEHQRLAKQLAGNEAGSPVSKQNNQR